MNKSPHPHEAKALEEIRRALVQRDDIKLFERIELFDEATQGPYEVDLIVVSTQLIFITELKHWQGRTAIAGEHWERQGNKEVSPHNSNNHKCKIFRSKMHRFCRDSSQMPFVQSIVVLTHPGAIVTGATNPSGDIRSLVGKRCLTFKDINGFVTYANRALDSYGRQPQFSGKKLIFNKIITELTEQEKLQRESDKIEEEQKKRVLQSARGEHYLVLEKTEDLDSLINDARFLENPYAKGALGSGSSWQSVRGTLHDWARLPDPLKGSVMMIRGSMGAGKTVTMLFHMERLLALGHTLVILNRESSAPLPECLELFDGQDVIFVLDEPSLIDSTLISPLIALIKKGGQAIISCRSERAEEFLTSRESADVIWREIFPGSCTGPERGFIVITIKPPERELRAMFSVYVNHFGLLLREDEEEPLAATLIDRSHGSPFYLYHFLHEACRVDNIRTSRELTRKLHTTPSGIRDLVTHTIKRHLLQDDSPVMPLYLFTLSNLQRGLTRTTSRLLARHFAHGSEDLFRRLSSFNEHFLLYESDTGKLPSYWTDTVHYLAMPESRRTVPHLQEQFSRAHGELDDSLVTELIRKSLQQENLAAEEASDLIIDAAHYGDTDAAYEAFNTLAARKEAGQAALERARAALAGSLIAGLTELQLAGSYFNDDWNDEMKKHYGRLICLFPDDQKLYFELGKLQSGRLGFSRWELMERIEPIHCFTHCIELDPAFAEAHFELASLFLRDYYSPWSSLPHRLWSRDTVLKDEFFTIHADYLEKGLHHMQEAFRLDRHILSEEGRADTWAEELIFLAHCDRVTEVTAGFKRHYDPDYSPFPAEYELLESIALMFERRHEWNDAIEYYRMLARAEKISEESAALPYLRIARMYHELDQAAQAGNYAELAEKELEGFRLRYYLALLNEHRGTPLMHRFLKDIHHYLATLISTGDAYAGAGFNTEASRVFSQCLRELTRTKKKYNALDASGEAEGYLAHRLATLMYERDAFQDVLRYARKALRVDKNNADLHGLMAHCHSRLSQPVKALQAIRKAISLKPELEVTLAALRFSLETLQQRNIQN